MHAVKSSETEQHMLCRVRSLDNVDTDAQSAFVSSASGLNIATLSV